MKLKFSQKFASVFAVASLVVGCAKDSNLDDYKRQQAQEDLAALSVINGTYTGELTDANNNPLGAMEVQLDARLVANPNSDGTIGTAAASPVATITYINGSTAITFSTATSNYANGFYSGTIQIPTTNPTASTMNTTYQGAGGSTSAQSSTSGSAAGYQQLNITMSISGDQITQGVIKATTGATYVLNFALTKNGPAVTDVAAKLGSKVASRSPTATPKFSYIGQTTFYGSNQTKPVQVQVLKPITDTAQDFLGLVVPLESVSVGLNYGPGAAITGSGTRDLSLSVPKLTFTSSVTDTNLVSGVSTTTNPAIAMTTNCEYSNNNKTLTCSHYATSQIPNSTNAPSTSQGTKIAETVATLASNNQGLPPDTSSNRDPISRTYQGFRADQTTGKKVSVKEIGGVSSSRVDLMVTFLPKSRTDEIYDLLFAPAEQSVIATVIAFADDADSEVAIPVSTVTWDQTAGTLSGTGTISLSGGTTATVTLFCSNFLSTPTTTSKTPFVCDYISNANGAHIHFVGTGK